MDKVEKWRIRLRESVHLEVQAGGRTRASEALVSVCGLPYTGVGVLWLFLRVTKVALKGSWPLMRPECQAKGLGLVSVTVVPCV